METQSSPMTEDDLSHCNQDDSDFEIENDNTNVNSKTTKDAQVKRGSSKSKKTSSKNKGTIDTNILAERSINEVEPIIPPVTKGRSKKTVEQTYQKKSQVEHILIRPDTYIGSVEQIEQPMYVLDHDDEIVEKNIKYTPGLYKIYDEILVNAADNKQRDPEMNKLDIEINAESNIISVMNNGKGIPIVIHKEHKCYVPTLIFGHLLTGSNFDDEEKKTTGGRNGYGAKLANIFSTEFTVECVDSTEGKKFHQVFKQNMHVAGKPKVKKCSAAEKKRGDYVKISFSPDLKRFKMGSLDEDTVALLSKRAYDIAGSMANKPGKKLVVTLNKKRLNVKNFQSYLKAYKEFENLSAYEKVGDCWEVGVGVSDGTFQQISFVNAICTSKGGQHVNHIADQVAKRLVNTVNKKNKGGVKIKESQMKNHICIYINCLIQNPAFDSQTKECLTTRKNAFGSTCDLSDNFMKQIEKSGVVEKILAFAKFKQNQALQKQGGTKKKKLTGIAKLDDANFAGSAKSKDCTLILTEGDSAKSLAMSGLSVVGRDYYGVFPLKGKPLNVREATHNQVMNNIEIKNVVDIMGLKFGTKYDENNLKSLRYGHLTIMADQDHDGSHIKGLIINIIHHFWPSLLDIPGFLKQFITPIVKATKRKTTHPFFTLPEYTTWKESTGNEAKGWTVKYYKGLGTSTSAEAKEYFSDLYSHEIKFKDISNDNHIVPKNNESDVDSEIDIDQSVVPDEIISGSALIEMAFSKKCVEDRKKWLNNLKVNTFLDYSAARERGVNYSDFINRVSVDVFMEMISGGELILFSQADCLRSIPHIYDGFKPSQRKVLFSCFLKNATKEIKVAQLSGFIGEKSSYHHGEASLAGTIINMAQNFVGSNNINLLTPAGQFGTRRMGGKDAASPRYIFTKLEKIARKIFHPDDDDLLTYLNDDGQSIEPEFYMPVIPLVLVNGCEGIGTGWSSFVPNYDPRLIIENIRRLIKGEETIKMSPHYYGFTGNIEQDSTKTKCYHVSGKAERIDDTSIFISELPIKKWTQDYKVFLESMITGEKKGPEIKDFKENHTDSTVSFTIEATKEKIDEFEEEKNGGLMGKLKLSTTINCSNMNLFDNDGRITKFSSPESIIKIFYVKRLQFYVLRKANLLKKMRREQLILSNKARFIEEVCNEELIVSNRKRADILSNLKEADYDLFPKEKKDKIRSDETNEEDGDSENDSEDVAVLAKGYEYLLGMKIWSLTFEKAELLRNELLEKTQAIDDLEATTPKQIWENDMVAIEEELDERDEVFSEAVSEEKRAMKNNGTKGRKGRKKGRSKTQSLEDDDEDFMPIIKTANKKRPPRKMKIKQITKKSLVFDKEEFLAPESDDELPTFAAQKIKPKKISKRSIVSDKAKYIGSESDEEMPSLTAQKIKAKNISKRDTVSDKVEYLASESDEEISSLTAQKIKTKDISRKSTLSDKAEYLASESDEEISSLTVQKIKTKNISRKSIVSNKAEYLASLTLSSLTENISRKSILSDKAEYLSSDSDEEIPSLTARKMRTKKICKRNSVSDKAEYLASESDEEIPSLKKKTSKISKVSDKAEYASSESDEEIPSLAARIQQRMSVSPMKEKKVPSPSLSSISSNRIIGKKRKRPSLEEDEECNSSDSEFLKIPTKYGTAKKAKFAESTGNSKIESSNKKKRMIVDDSSDHEEIGVESEEESLDADKSSDESDIADVVVPPRGRSSRERKSVSYVIDSDSDSDFE